MDRWSRSCFDAFRCLGNTSCSFHIAFICMHLPSFSFHLHSSSFQFVFMSLHFPLNIPFMFLSFVLMSFHFPFIFISRCIHVLSFFSFACMFSHFAFMSFHVLFKVVDMALWCNKWLSLNNPPNTWHSSKEMCNKNDRQREREKERKKEKKKEINKERKKERESKRVGCQIIW